MSNTLKFPFCPDFVTYTAYKFDLCDLCKIEKEIHVKFDNKYCPHCKKKTKLIMGSYSPTQDTMKIHNSQEG